MDPWAAKFRQHLVKNWERTKKFRTWRALAKSNPKKYRLGIGFNSSFDSFGIVMCLLEWTYGCDHQSEHLAHSGITMRTNHPTWNWDIIETMEWNSSNGNDLQVRGA